VKPAPITVKKHVPTARRQNYGRRYPLFWRINLIVAWLYCPALSILMHSMITRNRINWQTIIAFVITLILMSFSYYDKINPLTVYIFTSIFMFSGPW